MSEEKKDELQSFVIPENFVDMGTITIAGIPLQKRNAIEAIVALVAVGFGGTDRDTRRKLLYVAPNVYHV